MNKPVYVYDIETYPNIFTFVFRPVQQEKEYLVFDYDKDDRKIDFRDIQFKETRMADTKFEDIED